MTMHCRSALHFSLTTTVALHIEHVFVIESDEEVLILASFFQIIYKCSRFIFITTALKSHFPLVLQKHSIYKNLCMQHENVHTSIRLWLVH